MSHVVPDPPEAGSHVKICVQELFSREMSKVLGKHNREDEAKKDVNSADSQESAFSLMLHEISRT